MMSKTITLWCARSVHETFSKVSSQLYKSNSLWVCFFFNDHKGRPGGQLIRYSLSSCNMVQISCPSGGRYMCLFSLVQTAWRTKQHRSLKSKWNWEWRVNTGRSKWTCVCIYMCPMSALYYYCPEINSTVLCESEHSCLLVSLFFWKYYATVLSLNQTS